MMRLWRRAVVGSGILLAMSCSLQAQQAAVPSGQMNRVDYTLAGPGIVPATNADMQGVAWPGTHTVATNQLGVPVHRFFMQPVVTNMTLLTNDLHWAEQRGAELEREVGSIPLRERQLREEVLRSRSALMNVATNFVPADDGGKDLKAKIEKLGKELQALSADYRRLLEADPAYKQAKARVDADVEAYRVFRERKGALREERRQVMAELQRIHLLEKIAVPATGATNAAAPQVEPRVR